MNRRRGPFTPLTGRQKPLQRGPSHDLGFVDTVKGLLQGAKREIEALIERVGPKYGYGEGVAASYIGERVFSPEQQNFTLDLYLEGDNVTNQQPVNYVVRDAVDHTIPIYIDGPGVFLAKYFEVSIHQRWWSDAQQQEIWLPIPSGKCFQDLSTALPSGRQTIKWSIMHKCSFPSWPNQTASFNYDTDDISPGVVGVNYFWNLIDGDSSRKLCPEPISDQVLLNQSWEKQCDGGLMAFEVPWLFERAGQLDFEMRLINPILQLAPTATLFPFVEGVAPFTEIDDREVGGTVRNQSVRVRAALHGTKFYSERDLLLREAA